METLPHSQGHQAHGCGAEGAGVQAAQVKVGWGGEGEPEPEEGAVRVAPPHLTWHRTES